MRRSYHRAASYLLSKELRVDWRQFFLREDCRASAMSRLAEGRAIEVELQQGREQRRQQQQLQPTADGAPAAAAEGGDELLPTSDPMVTALETLWAQVRRGECTVPDTAGGLPIFLRASDASGHQTTVDEIQPRCTGQPLMCTETDLIAAEFVRLHALDGLIGALTHRESLVTGLEASSPSAAAPLEAHHLHMLLRLFLFSRDKGRCDRVLELLVKRGAVTQETVARMIDGYHVFLQPPEALAAALRTLHTTSCRRRLPLAARRTLEPYERAGLPAEALALHSEALEAAPLSSLLHLLACGTHHCVLPLLVVVWIRALGCEPSAWDTANLIAALASRPQDTALVAAVFASQQTPLQQAPPSQGTAASPSSSASSSEASSSIPSGTVTIQSLLYALRDRGVLSAAAHARLKALVAKLNNAVDKAVLSSTSSATSAAPGGEDVADVESAAYATGVEALLQADPTVVLENPATAALEAMREGDGANGQPLAAGHLRDFPAATVEDAQINAALPGHVEALLGQMILSMALSRCAAAAAAASRGVKSPDAPASAARTRHVLISALKQPIRAPGLNEGCSGSAMVRRILDAAVVDAPSVGPYRESAAHLTHFAALLTTATRHDVAAVRWLGVAEGQRQQWEAAHYKKLSSPTTIATDVNQNQNFHHHVEAVRRSVATGSGTVAVDAAMEAARAIFAADAVSTAKKAASDGASASSASPDGDVETSSATAFVPPFALSAQFLFDMAMLFPSVPLTVAMHEAAAYKAGAVRLMGVTPSPEADTKEISSDSGEAASAPSSSPVASPSRPPTPAPGPAITANERAFLSAYSAHFITDSESAAAAWAQVRDVTPPNNPLNIPRSGRKMMKVYAEVCARHPPRNCKMSAEGLDERRRWGQYLDARETALMLMGSGQAARDMMRHLYYNGNRLPAARDTATLRRDEATLLPVLPRTAVGDVASRRACVEAATNGLRVASPMTALGGGNGVTNSTAKTGLEETAARLLAQQTTPNPLQAQSMDSTRASASSSLCSLVSGPPSPMRGWFASEASWLRGSQGGVVPQHLFDGAYNHNPHCKLNATGLDAMMALQASSEPSTQKGSSPSPASSGAADAFTSDPFVPLWGYIAEAYGAAAAKTSGGVLTRPWFFDDPEMFLLLLRNLIYRLDWQNAVRLVLLFIEGSKPTAAAGKNPMRSSITSFSRPSSAGGAGAEPDPEESTTAVPAVWTFAIDHATSTMFEDIGDPQGFLPFKVATKLFDGRIVTKVNRMGRVHESTFAKHKGPEEAPKKRRFV